MESYTLHHGDCLEIMREMEPESIDLVIADPPYGIGVTTKVDNKTVKNDWDIIDSYAEWSLSWLSECVRVLKPNGVLYMWHNNFGMLAEVAELVRKELPLSLVSFCIWDKGNSYRAQVWLDRTPGKKGNNRLWFNICEYCLHYFKTPPGVQRDSKCIANGINVFRPLKNWYEAELLRLGITKKDISKKHTEVFGWKPHALNHYFSNIHRIPTKEAWEKVYIPLGFELSFGGKKNSYAALKAFYDSLYEKFDEQRNYHMADAAHCNVWRYPVISSINRLHTCQKPAELLRRLVRVSSREDAVVFDPFMGSGSTGVAAVLEGRGFIGIEKDEKYYAAAKERIKEVARIGKDPADSRGAKPVDDTLKGQIEMFKGTEGSDGGKA